MPAGLVVVVGASLRVVDKRPGPGGLVALVQWHWCCYRVFSWLGAAICFLRAACQRVSHAPVLARVGPRCCAVASPLLGCSYIASTPHAALQSALAKERRELREQQNRMLLEAIPKDLSKPWEDPLAGGWAPGGRVV